jgi:small-conductance mechanosensitive channel/CRP-like cAMP-binding protein
MFRDLHARVSPRRRLLAWIILVLLLGACALFATRLSQSPVVLRLSQTVFWGAVAFVAVRAAIWLLIDPLLRQRQTATPGFARDILVFALYAFAVGGVLRHALDVSIIQLLGTGAIVAAVVGLSLQEVLGNLFAGISLHLDPTFREGDWIEVSGSIRGGAGRDTYVGLVEAMTWRTVQMRTENGDTDIFPNRVLAQAVVTNLYVPAGFHRRTTKVVVEPHPDLHLALRKLTVALAGVPHVAEHQPEVVVWGSDLGGAVLEARVWALGFRHGRAAVYHATRLMTSVLPREGFSLLGPHGPTTPHEPLPQPTEPMMKELVEHLRIPAHWAEDLRPHLHLRKLAPGEGVIREGDPGESLFAVLQGQLHVVRPVERTEPYTGLFWEVVAVLGPGDWFGEASLLTGAPRNATVVAADDTLLVEIRKAGFEASLRREPELVERLVDLMESRQPSDQRPTETRRHLARQAWMQEIRTWFGLG